MKTINFNLSFLLIIFLFLLFSSNSYAQLSNKNGEIYTTEISVKFKSRAVDKINTKGVANLNNFRTELKEVRDFLFNNGASELQKIFIDANWGDTIGYNIQEKVVKLVDLSQTFLVKFKEPVNMWETVYELRKLPEVEFADPPTFIVNDIFPNDLNGQGYQWNLGKVNALSAWDISTGSNSVVVAVIDNGVDASHNDLSAKLSGGETGYFGGNNNHGTLVAGVVGAATDNGLGIASLGWNTMVRPYNYNNSTGSASDIISAVNSGANVLNCSWRTVTIDPNDNTKYINYDDSNIRNAIQNAITLGRIVVASAGNPPAPIQFSDGITRTPSQYPPFLQYPAANAGVIAVSATNSLDQFPSGYNYGSHVDLCAPSIAILTTGVGNSYPVVDGTSFGSPLVAALSSLILSVNSSFTGTQVANILETSSDDLGTVGRDDFYGYGRINALRSLANAYVQTNSQYLYNEEEMNLSLIQSDYNQIFQGSPAPGIAPGVYRCDRYVANKTFSAFAQTPQGWLISPEGFSNANPNTCYPWHNKTTTDNSIEIKTYFYFIRYGVGGNLNLWVPFDPNPTNLRKASALGIPLVAPLISNITQNPVPIYKGTYGYAYCNLAQGNGNLTYDWFSTNQPSHVSIVPEGYRCKIFYLPTETTTPIEAPGWNFGCTVSNEDVSGWTDTKTFQPTLNPLLYGCPTLAFDNRGTLTSENPLLITSMSNPGKDVTDYYLINTPLTANNNKINLTIHEPQKEHTWFDNVSLLETRANPDETLVVNDEGQVINYKGVLPARILLNGETDITQNLLELDSLSVELNPGDKLTISRNAVEGDGDVVLGGEEPPPAQKRISAMLMNITRETKLEGKEEIIKESIPIANFFFRPNKSIISKKLRNLPTGIIEITVNKKLTLDYFVFVTDLRTSKTKTLPLLSAVHNINGDIKSKLTGIDQNYAELYPTERIDLSFGAANTTENVKYFLKTVGRYETDTTFFVKQNNLAKINEQPIVPTENRLYDNYPNPFNPSTTINYSLKNDGRVTLKIFNTLGEEIITLVDELKPAGNYEAAFNASNLPSGVYIYRMQSGSFVSSKKMILIK